MYKALLIVAMTFLLSACDMVMGLFGQGKTEQQNVTDAIPAEPAQTASAPEREPEIVLESQMPDSQAKESPNAEIANEIEQVQLEREEAERAVQQLTDEHEFLQERLSESDAEIKRLQDEVSRLQSRTNSR